MTEFPTRDQIEIGMRVLVELKQDQGTGKLTEGIVKKILTSANSHPYGIMVELDGEKIGRTHQISSNFTSSSNDLKKIKNKIAKKIKTLDVNVTPNTLSQNQDDVNLEIPKDEDLWNEFKSTFQYDLTEENLRRNGKTEAADARKNNYKKIRDEIQKEVSLTVAAFANQEGGRLFIGVNNDGSVLGLGRDLKEYGNSNDDLRLAIRDSLKKFLQNNAFILKLRFKFSSDGEKQYLVIKVPKSTEPIYVHVSNAQEAYVRSENSSEKISIEDFLKHCKERFPNL